MKLELTLFFSKYMDMMSTKKKKKAHPRINGNVQLRICKVVLASAAHILKLERYRED